MARPHFPVSVLAMVVCLQLMTATRSFAQSYCTAASPHDNVSDSQNLQNCLNLGGTILLSAGSPGYIIDDSLRLLVNGTVLSSVSTTNRPTIIAHPNLHGEMLRADADDFEISFLIFDGNRANRTNSCSYPNGHNLLIRGGGFVIRFINSDFARCGSALEILGADFQVYNNTFAYNGWSADERTGEWSDGVTIHRCDGGSVTNNQMAENTDIGIVVNEGTNCTIRFNDIWNENRYAFAGFHVSTGASGGDHGGGLYSDNTIWASLNRMGFGLVLGAEHWFAARTSNVGTVGWNYIQGAVINLAVDGIDGGTVTGNTTYAAQDTRGYGTCQGQSADEFIAAHNGGGATIQSGWVSRTCH